MIFTRVCACARLSTHVRQINAAHKAKSRRTDCVLRGALSTIPPLPESNTSDIDWHAHSSTSVPRRFFALAGTAAHCLHSVRNYGRGRTPSRACARRQQRRRLPDPLRRFRKSDRLANWMQRLSDLPVTPELQHDADCVSLHRSAGSHSVPDNSRRRPGSTFPSHQPAFGTRTSVYLLVQTSHAAHSRPQVYAPRDV